MSRHAEGGLVLTPEFAAGLASLHAGRSVFVTGEAGTGKTTLVREFLGGTERNVLVAAPTGIAALNLGGHTLHHVFSFPTTITPDEVRGRGYYPGRFAGALRTLDVLVIDEASMLRADLFDCVAAALARFGPSPGEPFGGVQLVLVGDLHQLAPVVPDALTEYFKTTYETPFFFSAECFGLEGFDVVNLTTVFRQRGDARLIQILNQVRLGVLTAEVIDELNALVDPDFEPPEDEFWLTLTPTNSVANKHNKERLSALAGVEHESHADVLGDLSGFSEPTDRVLRFKVGAQIMLLTNDPQGRWFNGSIGTIAWLDGERARVRVLLQDGQSVWLEPYEWQITAPKVEGGRVHHEVVGTFSQLPFRLAWAVTIHKSQGQTLDRLVVDLGAGMFADGQLYVALSRSTSMEGLVLRRPVRPKDLRADQRVRRFATDAAGERPALPRSYLVARLIGRGGAFLDKPRPVEIAVVTDAGEAAHTLVNPERDLEDARGRWGISAELAALAPTLDDAWPGVARVLAGTIPVGVGIDHLIECIDYELKRRGSALSMPLGIDALVLSDDLAARGWAEGSALRDAWLLREAASASWLDQGAGHVFPGAPGQDGWWLRTEGSTIVLGATPSSTGPRGGRMAKSLRGVAEGECLTAWQRGVLLEAEAALGLPLLPSARVVARPPQTTEVLIEGARICFTGTATVGGVALSRTELEDLAASQGLVPVKNVTKTRCDVLVVAEIGSQSGKAKKAVQLGKPVLSVGAFLGWADGSGVQVTQQPEAPPRVIIDSHAPHEPS